ncbi:hypothetical protein C4556_00855 [Candidatus Parcubacteria bacterium]|nr:MAG: hypothetical protein C4556_00855 [Candidatus Parcubacteria bacterium]
MAISTLAFIDFTTAVKPTIHDFYRWQAKGFDGFVGTSSQCSLELHKPGGKYWCTLHNGMWHYEGAAGRLFAAAPVVPIFAELGEAQVHMVRGAFGKFVGGNAVTDYLAKETEAVTRILEMVSKFEELSGVAYLEDERERLAQKLLHELAHKPEHEHYLDKLAKAA